MAVVMAALVTEGVVTVVRQVGMVTVIASAVCPLVDEAI